MQLSTGAPASLLTIIITVPSLQYLAVRAHSPDFPPPSEFHSHFPQLHPKLAAGGLAICLLGFTLGPMPHLSGLARELVYSRHFLASEGPWSSFFVSSSGVASTEHGELGIDQSPSPSILLHHHLLLLVAPSPPFELPEVQQYVPLHPVDGD